MICFKLDDEQERLLRDWQENHDCNQAYDWDIMVCQKRTLCRPIQFLQSN